MRNMTKVNEKSMPCDTPLPTWGWPGAILLGIKTRGGNMKQKILVTVLLFLITANAFAGGPYTGKDCPSDQQIIIAAEHIRSKGLKLLDKIKGNNGDFELVMTNASGEKIHGLVLRRFDSGMWAVVAPRDDLGYVILND